MKPAPVGRTTRMSFYSPGGEAPSIMGQTWLEAEAFAYPHGGFTRRAYVRIGSNPHAPIANTALLDAIGTLRTVRVSIPDTYFSIPARLRYRGKTWKGFVSVLNGSEHYTFTPEAED